MMRQEIQVDDVNFFYEKTIAANKDINLSINQGEIYRIIGPNGAGKSTLMKQMVGILIPSSGKIHVRGLNMESEWEQIKTMLGYQSQFLYGLSEMKVDEILYYTGLLKKMRPSEARRRSNELIEYFSMKDFKEKMIINLSGGMRKVTNFCLSVINDPKILFLDEPTTGMDPQRRQLVWKLIQQKAYKDGATVVVASHHLNDLEEIISNMILLDNGEVQFSGTPLTFKQQLEVAYCLRVTGHLSDPLVQNSHLTLQQNNTYGCQLKSQEDVQRILHQLFSNENKIEDISINTTSLENAYIQYRQRNGCK